MRNARGLALIVSVVTGVGAICASSAFAQSDEYHFLGAGLFGETVTGAAGDENALGDFDGELKLAEGEICYYLEVEQLPDATDAHIHRGELSIDGEVVATLQITGESGDEACSVADPAVLREIIATPDAFYIDVHSTAFPAGAIRSQLSD